MDIVEVVNTNDRCQLLNEGRHMKEDYGNTHLYPWYLWFIGITGTAYCLSYIAQWIFG